MRTYNMSPAELEALENYINEALQGYRPYTCLPVGPVEPGLTVSRRLTIPYSSEATQP